MTLEDMQTIGIVSKRDCLTIQHYNYECSRPLNNMGKPFGNTNGAILSLEVVVDNFHLMKTFYERLGSNEAYNISMIFNPFFKKDDSLDKYDQVIDVRGYVIDIHENYSTEKRPDGAEKQMSATVQFLISALTYKAGGNSLEEVIAFN